MTARPAPSPSSSQPTTLPARRTTTAPRVAYNTAAGAELSCDTASFVTRSLQARTVSTAPASDSAVTEAHRTAVARLEPVTGTPL